MLKKSKSLGYLTLKTRTPMDRAKREKWGIVVSKSDTPTANELLLVSSPNSLGPGPPWWNNPSLIATCRFITPRLLHSRTFHVGMIGSIFNFNGSQSLSWNAPSYRIPGPYWHMNHSPAKLHLPFKTVAK